MPTDFRVAESRIGRAEWTFRAWESAGITGRLLSPVLGAAESVYRLATRVRNLGWDRGWFTAEAAPIPVVSVGNIAVGGAGKTPFAAWLAVHLRDRGERPAILHGGYAADEPALHRQWNPGIPVYVGRDRRASAGRAADEGATVAVLDDGFQHRRLARDLDIVLISAETWTAAPRLLPRGPWREPPTALRRAGLVVITRKSADPARAGEVANGIAAFAPGAPCCVAAIEPSGWKPVGGGGPVPVGPCIAVAGIAAPRTFLENARTAGAEVTGALFFEDHHQYTAGDARRIAADAAGRGIVTTEKDAVKLARLLPGAPVWALRQSVRMEAGGDALTQLLDRLGA